MKRRIAVASAKAKGYNLQCWVCEQISRILKIPWGTADEDLIRPRPSGQHGVDVILVGDAIKKLPVSIECKSAQQWNLFGAIRQSRKNKKQGTLDILVLKRKEFKDPFVLIDAKVFIHILKSINPENNDYSKYITIS